MWQEECEGTHHALLLFRLYLHRLPMFRLSQVSYGRQAVQVLGDPIENIGDRSLLHRWILNVHTRCFSLTFSKDHREEKHGVEAALHHFSTLFTNVA